MSYSVAVFTPAFLSGFNQDNRSFDDIDSALRFAKAAIKANHRAHATVTAFGHLAASVSYAPSKTLGPGLPDGRVVTKKAKGYK